MECIAVGFKDNVFSSVVNTNRSSRAALAVTKSPMMLVIFRAEYELVEIDLQIKIKLRKSGARFTRAVHLNQRKEENPWPLTSHLLYQDSQQAQILTKALNCFEAEILRLKRRESFPCSGCVSGTGAPWIMAASMFCPSSKGGSRGGKVAYL